MSLFSTKLSMGIKIPVILAIAEEDEIEKEKQIEEERNDIVDKKTWKQKPSQVF